MTDLPMTGAEFRRHVGVDPERWAERFLAAYAIADGINTQADRQAFVAGWFKDAMAAMTRECMRWGNGLTQQETLAREEAWEAARRDQDVA